jgi:hypothetical protein
VAAIATDTTVITSESISRNVAINRRMQNPAVSIEHKREELQPAAGTKNLIHSGKTKQICEMPELRMNKVPKCCKRPPKTTAMKSK